MNRVSRAAKAATMRWSALVLLVFEVVTRRVTRPDVLLSLHVPGYGTAFEHRRVLAARVGRARTNTGHGLLVVLGDSTAERGLNACSMASRLKREPAALAVPSGGTREAETLLAETGTGGADRILYAVNPLNVATHSEWIEPTFEDLVRRTDLATAAVGTAYATFGKRDAVLAVLDRAFEPQAVEATFAEQIGLTGVCGRELAEHSAPQVPDPATWPRQVRSFGRNWGALFREEVPEERTADLAASLRALRRSGEVTVVLMPVRSDFRQYLETEYPTLLARRRAAWAESARLAAVSGIDCAGAVPDDTLFEDPVHLHELGRAALSSCLVAELASERTCCTPLSKGSGTPAAMD